jgi:hypothetical protein
MSDEMVSELTRIIGLLAECDETLDGVPVVNRDEVIEALRGVIQNEWMRTGVLAQLEETA